MNTIQTTLPRGIYSGTTCHRVAILRPLTGRQEVMIAARPPDARAVSRVLADRLVRIGGIEEFSPQRVSQLTRGDRAHLLLCLRALMLGDELRLTLTCPNPSCHAPLPLTLSIRALCTVQAAPALAKIPIQTSAGEAILREPTGEDDALLEETSGHRDAVLWSRLLLRLGHRTGLTADDWRALPAGVRHAIALGLARHHRGPQLFGSASCSGCAAGQEWRIDPAGLLSAELRTGAARIIDEVHALAWHYHWSEESILDMPRRRRWRYLRLLSAALSPEASAP